MRIANILKYTASVAVLAAFAGSASAQEANRQVDEIVVTAQKREQSLQSIPVAVFQIASPLEASRVKEYGAKSSVPTRDSRNTLSGFCARRIFPVAVRGMDFAGMYLTGKATGAK